MTDKLTGTNLGLGAEVMICYWLLKVMIMRMMVMMISGNSSRGDASVSGARVVDSCEAEEEAARQSVRSAGT